MENKRYKSTAINVRNFIAVILGVILLFMVISIIIPYFAHRGSPKTIAERFLVARANGKIEEARGDIAQNSSKLLFLMPEEAFKYIKYEPRHNRLFRISFIASEGELRERMAEEFEEIIKESAEEAKRNGGLRMVSVRSIDKADESAKVAAEIHYENNQIRSEFLGFVKVQGEWKVATPAGIALNLILMPGVGMMR